jgi:hypothetical protein
MTLITDVPIFESRQEQLLTRLRNIIDNTVHDVWNDNYETYTQEPAFTASIAQAIKTELEHHPLEVDGLRIEVSTQSVPDRGQGAMEKRTGTDLYISLVRNDTEIPVSKGMLVQAKMSKSLIRDRRDLRNQASRMLRRSKDSYIWVYGPTGIVAVPAKRAAYPRLPGDFFKDGISVGELIADGLRCNAGDPKIGIDTHMPKPRAMNAMMERLSARKGLNFSMVDDSST